MAVTSESTVGSVSCETAARRSGREHGIWGIFIGESRNLATAGERKLKRRKMCCSGKSSA
jgi:hypothetical protein